MQKEELELIIMEYGNELFRFCLKICMDRYDAEELYQETFLKLMESKKIIDRSRNPKSFLFSVAIGIFKNHKKKYAVRKRIAPMESIDQTLMEIYSEHDNPTERDCIELLTLVQLEREIFRLDDKYRIPLVMCYTNGFSYAEIAEALRIPKGTVKSRIFKAKEILQERLEDWRDEV